MRQFQFEYLGVVGLKKEIAKIRQWCEARVTSCVIFRFFTESQNKKEIEKICGIIEKEIPQALYFGCSTNGNIMMGEFKKGDITISCTVLEYPTTKAKMLQYELTSDNYKETTAALIREVEKEEWVTAVEMLTTIRGMSMTGFCEEMGKLRPGVEVFGGGAFNEDMNDNVACVFSNVGGYSEKAVVFLLLGGEDLHVKTCYMTGWKPLGREHRVTKASGCILYELDGHPAYDIYYKYLKIKNDESFFLHTLEFPFIYDLNGHSILRAPIASNEDGSLVMTSDMDENVQARIAYGDPWTILDIIHDRAAEFYDFQPEMINIFSCAARRTFWGDLEAGRETEPFQRIAPTSGFYTSGEFLRTDGVLNQHNVTLVVAALREGDVLEEQKGCRPSESYEMSGKVSMINRLATFIEAATEELEEANRNLAISARTDGLTGLFNRMEIQRRITAGVKAAVQEKALPGLIMMDIDNFKKVNDNYGHKEGDNVLRGLSSSLQAVLKESGHEAYAGRWGGEEFMVFLPGVDPQSLQDLAEKIRSAFASLSFEAAGHCTMSLGTAVYKEGENSDSFAMRVDGALYQAKNSGKNRVVAAE